jgi:hypothetical protein
MSRFLDGKLKGYRFTIHTMAYDKVPSCEEVSHEYVTCKEGDALKVSKKIKEILTRSAKVVSISTDLWYSCD